MQIDKVSDVGVEIRSLKSKLKDARARARWFKEQSNRLLDMVDAFRADNRRLRDEITAYQIRIDWQNQELVARNSRQPVAYPQDQLAAQHSIPYTQLQAQQYAQAQEGALVRLSQAERQCTCVPGRSALF